MISHHAPFAWSLVKDLGDEEPLFFTGEMVNVFFSPLLVCSADTVIDFFRNVQ